MTRVLVVGTGLIGASVGLALKASGFEGKVLGWDASAAELADALAMGAIDEALASREDVLASEADVIVLATPVMAILDWMQRLAPVLSEGVLVTDVGSTKREIAALAGENYNKAGRARFLRDIRWRERRRVERSWRRRVCFAERRGCLRRLRKSLR